jgi:putative serine protease PepD
MTRVGERSITANGRFRILLLVCAIGCFADFMVRNASASDDVSMLAKVRKSVFNVKVRIDSNSQSSGTAFLVTGDGLAVTNFHVVANGKDAEALFDGGGTAVPVELVAIRPEFDLALIRIPMNHTALKGVSPPHLAVASGPSPVGTSVWALGFPSMGFTVTRGIVSENRAFSQLPEQIKKAFRFDAGSEWIQTDCTINPGNSGGPLVDSAGMVIGVNTLRLEDGTNKGVFYALGARHIQSILAETHTKPIGFSQAVKAAAANAPAIAFPWLDIDDDVPADQVVGAARSFQKTSACKKCDGKGSVTTRRIVGREGIQRTPIYNTTTDTCPACKGSLYSSSGDVWRGATILAQRLSQMRTADPNSARTNQLVVQSLQKATDAGVPEFASMVNATAVTNITGTLIEVGSPVVCVGRVVRDIAADAGTSRLMVITIADRNIAMIVSMPKVVAAATGDIAVVGGLLAGRLTGGDGTLFPVLQGGFVVATKQQFPAPEPVAP